MSSINANIEAARSGGEAGRGFRVIADAVSRLADHSGAVGADVRENLEVLKASSQAIADSADERGEILSRHRNVAEEARGAKRRITENLERSRIVDEQVRRALSGQETGMEKLLERAAEMNRNEAAMMDSLHDLQGGFAAFADRYAGISEASAFQESSIAQVRELASRITELSEEAGELAGRFMPSD